jgi:hypothetical protein
LETATEDSKSGAKPTTRDVPKTLVLLPGVTEEKLAKRVGAIEIPGTAVDLPPEPVTVPGGEYTARSVAWSGAAGFGTESSTTNCPTGFPGWW